MNESMRDTPAPDSTAPSEDPPPAPPRKAVSPGLRGFLGGIAGGIAVSLAATGALLASLPSVQELLFADEIRRLPPLEQAIEEMNPRLAAVERAQANAAGNADAAAMAQTFAQRITALETQTHAPLADPRIGVMVERMERLSADVARLATDVQTLRGAIPPEGTILRLAERTEAAEKEVRDIAAQHASAQAMLLVVGQLRDALDRGDPYDFELQAVRRITGNPDDIPRIDALAASAAEGVPRKDTLIQRFPQVAKDALLAADMPADGALWQRALHRLTSLVRFRKIDGLGTGTADVIARTETWLRDGNLAKAAAELPALDGPAADVAAAWLKSARARLTADRVLSELSASTAAQTAKGGS